ncbi:MAG: hypothetical protein KAS66_16275 [Candidatus Omnitrophica bacterium]|nr:hypothetical protein [Candidatus Omnitrophota bacterium]
MKNYLKRLFRFGVITSIILTFLMIGAARASAQIVVPPGFSVQAVASGANLDIEPGQGGAFGMDVYYINEAASPNNIMRVDPAGGPPTIFASVPSAITLGFGFGGDLFAAEGASGAVSGNLWRIAFDGSVIFFASIPTFVEGIAFSSGGPFGTNLYVSEFGPDTIKAVDAFGATTILTGPGTIGTTPTGLEFGPGGAFGSDLYVIDRSGTIYTVTPAGVSSLFAGIDFGPLINRAETLAFGRSTTLFGENLFVAEEGTPGRILKISPDGVLTTFASGFPGFNTSGVTGLEFSKDGNTLFVTDDQTATLYAITGGPIEVDIDIKPGSAPNSINLCSGGAVPVAILGSDTFDVSEVNTGTLRFSGAVVKMVGKKDPHSLCSYEDVNDDFIDDLVCHYVTTDIAAIDGESYSATVNGELLDGTPIEGTDSVNIVKDTCN